MWFLKVALDTEELGLTVLELEPGGKGTEHDEAGTGQEDVYSAVDGTVEIELADETVSLESEGAIRFDPDARRQIHNRGDDRATLLLVGTPL